MKDNIKIKKASNHFAIDGTSFINPPKSHVRSQGLLGHWLLLERQPLLKH